jgi:DNA-binding Lrp family transcriptional regulator
MSGDSDRWREARRAWERLSGAAAAGGTGGGAGAGGGDPGVVGEPGDGGAVALGMLGDIGLVRRQLDEAELAAVRAARRAGRSWAEIAVKLGVTRQSAWERWRELDEPGLPPDVTAGVAAAAAATTAKAGPISRALTSLRRGQQVVVPNVVGLSLAAAQRRLAGRDLIGVLADHVDPASVIDPDRASVTDQIPEAGSTAQPATTVGLWIDEGGGSGVREPRRPRPNPKSNRQTDDEPVARVV